MSAKSIATGGCGCPAEAIATEVTAGLEEGTTCCINTYRIYDSCRTQECLEDIRILMTDVGQETLNSCTGVRVKACKILWTQISTEEMAFNRGYFQIDIRYYFYIVLECCLGFGNAQEIQGLAIYDKTVILYGGEGNISIFQSDIYQPFCSTPDLGGMNVTANLPRAVVEVAEPVALRLNIVDGCQNGSVGLSADSIPASICACYRGNFAAECEAVKTAYISLGVFSVIRIERPSQLVIPSCELCIPEKSCDSATTYSDPCTLFRSMSFPMAEFYPATSNYSPLTAQTLQASTIATMDPTELVTGAKSTK